jgi:hypothetical protein
MRKRGELRGWDRERRAGTAEFFRLRKSGGAKEGGGPRSFISHLASEVI